MEEKKLYCKYCVSRKSNGYCPKYKGFVPRKTNPDNNFNIAENCPDFKKK